MSRFVTPDTQKLDISQGDYLIVKKRLTAGESRRIMGRMVKSMRPGEAVDLDPIHVGRAKVVEYLIDWSIKDSAGVVVPIRGKTPDEIGQILDGLDLESFREILATVEAHEDAMDTEREQEKNVPAGSPVSATT